METQNATAPVAASQTVIRTGAAEETASENAAVSGETDAPVEMIAVRRRSRRRRRNHPSRLETPQRRVYIILLCVVVLLTSFAVVKPLHEAVYNWVKFVAPVLGHMGISLEVIALILAGLVLLYLMPGMEDRILRLLGIRRDKRR